MSQYISVRVVMRGRKRSEGFLEYLKTALEGLTTRIPALNSHTGDDL